MKMNKVKQLLRGTARRAGRGLQAVRSTAFSPRALSWLLLLVMAVHAVNLPFAAAAAASGAAKTTGRNSGGSLPRTSARAVQVAETFNVYGPRRFDRASGQATTVTESFNLPADAVAPFRVQLQNGAPDGSSRVSSATVKLNGADLFKQSDFSQQVVSLNRAVTLNQSNTLEVRLTSAPGSYVVITVTATRTQALPAALSSVSPARVLQGQSLSVTLSGSNTHWAAGQTRASLGEEVSVGGAAPGEPGPVSVTSPTTAVADIVVSPTAALAPRTARVVAALTGGDESVSLAGALTVAATNAPGSSASRVTTAAGAAGNPGFADGAGAQARFRSLSGIAAGPDDAIYVADAGNNRIRVVRGQTDAAGATTYNVSTLAGTGVAGYADGPAASAQFNDPQGVAVDAAGVVYVADTDNHRVRRIAADGSVTTLAGDGTPGFVNGAGAQARFNAPRGIAVDNFGNVYVADSGNSAVRRVTQAGEVSTVAGDGTVGSGDSPVARFDNLSGIACDGEHVFVYLGDTGNHRIRRLDATGTVITVAGASRGFADGSAAQARFAEPSGLALDASGKIVVADAVNSLVRLVDAELAAGGSAQAVTTLAGTGERGSTDGAGNVARFYTPRGVAVSQSSAVFVADTGNGTIRRILLPPVITALSPPTARPGEQITVLGERFDGRAPERNVVKFTRSAAAGGGQTSAHVVSATRTAATVEVPPDAASGPVTLQTEGGTATSPTDFTLATAPAPSIADFNPKHGPVGTSVNITGANLRADNLDPSVTFQGANGARLPALVTFSAAAEAHVVVPNGAVTGQIELTTAGGRATSPSPFTVDALQDFRLTVAPSSASAVRGSTATYVVSVNSDQATFTQLARLSVTGLPTGATAKFAPAQITSGASSTLSVSTPSSLASGNYQFTITATAEADGHDQSHTVNATLNVLAGGVTTLAGRVLSTEDAPIMGATVSLDGHTVTTDAAGSFILSGVNAGDARPLMVDGRTASAPNRTYPVILEPANIVAGQANVIPYNFYLPPIDTQYEVQVVPGQNTVAGNPRVPGLQMTIPAGANLRNRDGSPVARVSITPLAIDRTPTPLPSNVKTSIVYTSQPGGALTDIPVPVVYPNLLGLDPGTRVELYAFNHDTVRWYVYGYGRVSSDGRTIAPEINPSTGRPYGLVDFSWHFPNGGPGGNPGGPGDCGGTGANPVNYATGIKLETMTDVFVGGGRGSLTLTRFYTSDNSGLAFYGRFGRGTYDNYDVRLTGNWVAGGAGRVIMPDEQTGRLFGYARTDPDGTLVFTTTSTITQLGDAVRKLPNGTLEYRYFDGRSMSFDAGGHMTAFSDANGNATTLGYTGGRLTSVTDAVGRSLNFAYNSSGYVSRVTDPIGRVWEYTYGDFNIAGGGFLATVKDPLGDTLHYSYQGARLTSVVDARGNLVKAITYDGNGRVIRQQLADGGVETYDYELSGGVITSTTITSPSGRKMTKRFSASGYIVGTVDELGQTSQTTRDIGTNLPTETRGSCGCTEEARQFDTRGNVTASTDQLGQTTTYEYEPVLNNVTKKTDRNGRVTTYGYDSRGNLTSITNALNETTTFGYNAYGQITSVTDALGHQTTFEYDAQGNQTARVDPLGRHWTMEYDGAGRRTATVDPLGRRTVNEYDADDRVKKVTDPAGVVTQYEYDASGNLTKTVDALGHVWLRKYDAKNQLVSQTDPSGNVTRMIYDTEGEVTQVNAPSGRKMLYGYDARGQRTSITYPLGETARFAYDNRGNLVSFTDQRGNLTTWVYDEKFRPVSMRDPLGNKTTVEYDAENNIRRAVDRTGRQTVTTYDALNRAEQVAYQDAQVTYQYDHGGRIQAINDTQGGQIAYIYDEANRPLSETTPAGVVSYAYNDANQRTRVTPANRAPMLYGYDAGGRLQTVSRGAEVFTYDYDELSRRKGLTRPNGVVTTYGYDESSRLSRLTHALGLQPLEDFRYTYTSDGDVSSIDTLAASTAPSPSADAATADAANRIRQFGNSSYTFNEQGQTTSRTDGAGTTGYTWDARGRLTGTTLPDGQSISYSYDAFGRRISASVGGQTTSFLYDGLEVVADFGPGGAVTDYLNGAVIDEKLEQSSAAVGALYFLHDHLGSVRALTNGAGSVVERKSYEAFGASANGSLTRYGFTGREREDATGLVYYRARWYDPRQGRFLSEDPLGLTAGPNLYEYAYDNPLRFVDPTGNQGWEIVVGGGGAAALGGGGGAAAGGAAAGGALVAGGAVVAGVAAYGVVLYGAWQFGEWLADQPWNPLTHPAAPPAPATCRARPMPRPTPVPIPMPPPPPPLNMGDKWSCTATCNIQNFSNVPNAPERVTGFGVGPSEEAACENAKRNATQQAPRGTYARHCKCICSKR
jgi:RHS repeat-associated protein